MNRFFAIHTFLAGLLLAIGMPSTGFSAEIISVEPIDPDAVGTAPEPLTAQQLEDLVGPVALYPDDLLAVVLPASTYPLDIVKAARFLEARAQDSAAQPDDAWDESIIALLNYPEVVQMLDSDLDWTWALGEAVLFQEDELIAAVESFRDRAYETGNLRSDEHQVVEIENGAVSIEPVQREVIYVPYYEPRQVIVRQSTPVYHYYPRAYPVYYYPYPANYYFPSGFFWGVSTAFHIGFQSRRLRLHHFSYASHPYYGRHYYPAYYRHHRFHRSAPSHRNAYRASYRSSYRITASNRTYAGDRWRGSYRTGVRPREFNNYNYSPRQATRPRAVSRTQRTDAGNTARNNIAQTSRTSNRVASATSRRYGSAFAARPASREQRDSARDTSRTRQSSTRVSTTRPRAAARPDASSEQSRRQALQRNDARRDASREQPQRQAQQRTVQRVDASREQARRPSQQRAAAPAESRNNDARTQTRQRVAERAKSTNNNRSSSNSRSENRQRR